ncbi:MAG: hypothetical protein A3K19_16360 [Lentisphaerae bacterium RIFOXYB12_FULL_65_16]|nr:MAG: hypothetical protein A3K18_32790 [Lentisphaerae bacterium RIFOXYA12_64_32]OGV89017.1 MAG: hypothetical protein A3K19_16360 [Lentisphaerae bacterium RIFOXYB12_FULL_65_16]
MRVLEYGGGASTIWFAARVAEVVTLENNPVWARMLEKQVPANASVRYVKDMEVFDATMDGDLGKFHIVIIDCLANRIACAKKGLEFLREDGCIIWDDTNGPDWPAIQQLMEEYGFRSISFSGMTPQEVAGGRTTVFYRQDNSFGV